MVTKINGLPTRGFWFSKDVKTVTVVSTGGDFIDDADGVNGVDSALEQVLEVLQTRATVIALSITNATTIQVIVDYANAFTAGLTEATSGSVEEEVSVAIDLIAGLSSTTVDTFDGFVGATSA